MRRYAGFGDADRTGRNQLRTWSDDTPKRWPTRAVTAISYCWVESFSTAALETALKPIIDAKRSWSRRNSHERAIDGQVELADEEREIDSLATGRTLALPFAKKR